MTNDEHEDLDDEKERRGDGRWEMEQRELHDEHIRRSI
jgi:hypothetical protein